MFVNFSEEVRHILKQAEKEKDDLNHPYVGSEHLFLSLLKNSNLKRLFKRHKLTYHQFKKKLIDIVGVGTKKDLFTLYTPLLKKVLQESIIIAKEDNKKMITEDIIIISLLEEKDGTAYSILKRLNINIDKLYYDIKNKIHSRSYGHKKSILDDIGVDLTSLARKKKLDPVIGRDKEISKVIEVLLRRKKNNPILIGDAGVGKTAIVEEIANLIVRKECPSYLKNKRIVSLNIFSIVSGTKYRGEFEEKMKNVIRELEENDNIILFIDEIHTIVGAGGAEGAIDASNILKPALARGKIKIIGATTIDEYKKHIEPDAALSRRFQNIIIKEPTYKDVTKILKSIKSIYEKYHNIKISDTVIDEIVYLSDKYLTNRYEPDKSIDVLDEVCVKAGIKETNLEKRKKEIKGELNKLRKNKVIALKNKDFNLAFKIRTQEQKLRNINNSLYKKTKYVTSDDVLRVIESKCNINIYNTNEKRLKFYENLRKKLSNKIIGRKEIIDKIILSLKKKDILKKKECYSVLITGKKDVGKSYLANSFLSCLTNEKEIINIDLSEYKDYHMISKLIGTTIGYSGYDNKTNVFEKIRTNPSSYIIVDNYDEGCQEVQNLFIKILKNNKLDDAKGVCIDFSNTTIVFISKSLENDNIGFNSSIKTDDEELLDSLVSLSINIGELNEKETKLIIKNELDGFIKKYNIDIKYEKDYINYIYNNFNSISLINEYLKNIVENKIVSALLNKEKEILLKTSKV